MSDIVHVRTNIVRTPLKTVEAFRGLASATIHEASGKKGYIDCRIRALAPGMRICGPAFTVDCPPGDNSMLHKALERALPGDVIVATVGGAEEYGYWGELMTVSALARRVGGLCIEGCVRDSAEIAALGFPVFSTGLCIRGTGKGAIGLINYSLRFGGASIEPGDLIVGDDDGLVVISRCTCAEVLEKSLDRKKAEMEKANVLASGISSLEYNKLADLFRTVGLTEEQR
jgi:4-hydroxy-4-methyl-2-oxoglutarate aldolase